MDFYSPAEFQANFQIPFDLFVSKKHRAGDGGSLRFTDSSGNLVFRVIRQSQDSALPHRKRILLDASGNPLITLHRNRNGCWQGFRGDKNGEEDLLFKVERTCNDLHRTEFEVILTGDNSEDSKFDIKMKGCPFQRSCTLYKGDSIVAQSSLMYKLGFWKHFVSRRRFRLTVFPGFSDHSFVVALAVIYFDGRKFWI